MKKFILVSKETHGVVYGGPLPFGTSIFTTDNASPSGMIGGPGQILWYWVNVTAMADEDIKALYGKVRVPPEGEVIDPSAINVVVSGGTWEEPE